MKAETLFKKLWDTDEFVNITNVDNKEQRDALLAPYIAKFWRKWGKYVSPEFLDLLEDENYHTERAFIIALFKANY